MCGKVLRRSRIVAALGTIVALPLVACAQPEATPMATPSPSANAIALSTPTATPTETPRPTPTPTFAGPTRTLALGFT